MSVYPDSATGTISACVECLCLLANGECDPDVQGEVSQRMAENWPAPYSLVPGCSADCCDPEGDRTWFSWQPCDVCQRNQGGDREHVTWFDESQRTI